MKKVLREKEIETYYKNNLKGYKSNYDDKISRQLSLSSVTENENNLKKDYTVFNKSNRDNPKEMGKKMDNLLKSLNNNDNTEAENVIIDQPSEEMDGSNENDV